MPDKSPYRTSPVLGLYISGNRVYQDLAISTDPLQTNHVVSRRRTAT